ncbi:MAG: hypothetical protein WAT79_12995 [Saprospiraceae bacterium]
MKKKFIILFLVFLSFDGIGQHYKTSIGFRFGNNIGLNFSQRVYKGITVDLLHEPTLFIDRHRTAFMAKKHVPIITKRLNMFYGVGGYYQSQYLIIRKDEPTEHFESSGLVMVGGIDFTIGRWNFGYDIMPGIRFWGRDTRGWFFSSSAISLRYIIVPNQSKMKKWFKKI